MTTTTRSDGGESDKEPALQALCSPPYTPAQVVRDHGGWDDGMCGVEGTFYLKLGILLLGILTPHCVLGKALGKYSCQILRVKSKILGQKPAHTPVPPRRGGGRARLLDAA